MGGLLHFVQRGGVWAGCDPAQSPRRCTHQRPVYQGHIIQSGTVTIQGLIMINWRQQQSANQPHVHATSRKNVSIEQNKDGQYDNNATDRGDRLASGNILTVNGGGNVLGAAFVYSLHGNVHGDVSSWTAVSGQIPDHARR